MSNCPPSRSLSSPWTKEDDPFEETPSSMFGNDSQLVEKRLPLETTSESEPFASATWETMESSENMSLKDKRASRVGSLALFFSSMAASGGTSSSSPSSTPSHLLGSRTTGFPAELNPSPSSVANSVDPSGKTSSSRTHGIDASEAEELAAATEERRRLWLERERDMSFHQAPITSPFSGTKDLSVSPSLPTSFPSSSAEIVVHEENVVEEFTELNSNKIEDAILMNVSLPLDASLSIETCFPSPSLDISSSSSSSSSSSLSSLSSPSSVSEGGAESMDSSTPRIAPDKDIVVDKSVSFEWTKVDAEFSPSPGHAAENSVPLKYSNVGEMESISVELSSLRVNSTDDMFENVISATDDSILPSTCLQSVSESSSALRTPLSSAALGAATVSSALGQRRPFSVGSSSSSSSLGSSSPIQSPDIRMKRRQSYQRLRRDRSASMKYRSSDYLVPEARDPSTSTTQEEHPFMFSDDEIICGAALQSYLSDHREKGSDVSAYKSRFPTIRNDDVHLPSSPSSSESPGSVANRTLTDVSTFPFLFRASAVGFTPQELDGLFPPPPAPISAELANQEWHTRDGALLDTSTIDLFYRCYLTPHVRREDLNALSKFLFNTDPDLCTVYQDRALHIFTGISTYHHRMKASARLKRMFGGKEEFENETIRPALKISDYNLSFGLKSGEFAPVGVPISTECSIKVKGNESVRFFISPSTEAVDNELLTLTCSPTMGNLKKNHSIPITISLIIHRAGITAREVLVIEVEGGARYFVYFSIESDPRVFGVSPQALEQSTWIHDDIQIPSVLLELYTYLAENRGFEVEGIFRVGASDADIQLMRAQYDSGASEIQCPTPYAAAHLIKVFIREMPGNLLPLSVTDLDRLDARNMDSCVAFLDRLNDYQRGLFFFLLDVCVEVASRRASNKMGVENIAIVVSPNLLELEASNPLLIISATQKLTAFVAQLIHWRANTRHNLHLT